MKKECIFDGADSFSPCNSEPLAVKEQDTTIPNTILQMQSKGSTHRAMIAGACIHAVIIQQLH